MLRCEFALNYTCSASTGISLAYVVFCFKPTLPLEYAVNAITDGPVWSITDCIANMESTLYLAYPAVARSADHMVDYGN